jgi:hypothetical protein
MALRLFFQRSKKEKTRPNEAITIVSGLPRSGTSMMMKMLDAGGVEVLTDNLRTPDQSNPKGYYEFERVKKLKDGDHAWLENTRGKAVKIISALLEHLPGRYAYKVIFMRRHIPEILASQKQMLIRRGEATDKVSDEKLEELYLAHIKNIETWLAQQPNFEVIYISYNEILENPDENIAELNRFLGGKLDTQAMAQTISRDLYRERSVSR